MLCYCKSGKIYAECCQAIHLGHRQAQTAEELMRSRYTAFATADVNYLMRSHHSSSRPIREKKNILQFARSVDWMGLQIIRTQAGNPDDSEGWVEFKATYLEKGRLCCLHENSYFVKEKNIWYYKDGIQL